MPFGVVAKVTALPPRLHQYYSLLNIQFISEVFRQIITIVKVIKIVKYLVIRRKNHLPPRLLPPEVVCPDHKSIAAPAIDLSRSPCQSSVVIATLDVEPSPKTPVFDSAVPPSPPVSPEALTRRKVKNRTKYSRRVSI